MRYLGLITIPAAILSFGLTLGAAPQPAEAGKACQRARLPSPCIKANDIRNNQVRTNHVRNNNLSGIDMLDEAGAEFDLPPSGTEVVVVGTGDVTVSSVTLTLPAPGTVVVNANATVWYDGNSTQVRCEITPNSFLGSNFGAFRYQNVNANAAFESIAQTWAFNRPAGSFTINWVCDVTSANADFYNPMMTAVFVTTKY